MGGCSNCGKEVLYLSKGMCITCYKKFKWQPKKSICEKCGKEKIIHAKGMCKNCANKFLYYHLIKKHNYRKWHNIDLDLYRKTTQKCAICGFDKAVDLHHLDQNKKNNSESNLIGLCPNHHKMIHMAEYKNEILTSLIERGYNPSQFKFNAIEG
ncbi:MAG: HNH endonuclease signature motif containing protein [Nanoarchaeota archaeon]